MKISFYSYLGNLGGSGTSRMRCLQVSDCLSEAGVHCVAGGWKWSIPKPSDVIVLHRLKWSKETDRFISICKKVSPIVIYDIDDLLFTASGQEYIRDRQPESHVDPNLYKAAMVSADAITVSTQYLKSEAEKFHDNVYIVCNGLSKEYLLSADQNALKPLSKTRVRLAYLSGSATHDFDFAEAKDALLRIMKERPEVELLIVGPLNGVEEFSQFRGRFEHKSRVPYSEFRDLFENIDLNLVPLEVEQPFCQAKSELKYIEAAAYSVPTIASDTHSYSAFIKHGHNGFLVSREQGWYNALQSVLSVPEQLSKVGAAARSEVVNEACPAARAKRYLDMLEQMSAAGVGRDGVSGAGFQNMLSLHADVLRRRARRRVRKLVGGGRGIGGQAGAAR